jgi:hypothetical protein
VGQGWRALAHGLPQRRTRAYRPVSRDVEAAALNLPFTGRSLARPFNFSGRGGRESFRLHRSLLSIQPEPLQLFLQRRPIFAIPLAFVAFFDLQEFAHLLDVASQRGS